MDTQISNLRAQLIQLEDERSVLAESHQQHKAIMSPLRRMPPEILANIFLYTLPSSSEIAHSSESKTTQSPWILGQICSRWREIALSASSLWSIIHVSTKPNPLAMIQTQIDRARMLKIHYYSPKDGDSSPEILKFFEFLSEHSARWEELNIHLTNSLAPHMVALKGRLPSLRRLWVRWNAASADAAIESLKCFETCPSLKEIALARKDNVPQPLSVLFPATQLTTYRVRCPWKTHRDILRRASNIVEAKISVPSSDEPWSVPEVIDMTLLQRLYVSPSNVLEYLRAPALTGIVCVESQENSIWRDLDSFCIRSSCTLKQLCIEGLPDANITAEILEKYPSIKNLALMFAFGGEDELTNALDTHLNLFTQRDVPVFPHLEEICFGARRAKFPINYSLVLKMLQSRRNLCRTLNSATFVVKSGPSPDAITLSGLNALAEDGLNLRLFNGSSGMEMKIHLDRWMYGTPWIH
ncbi:hypothetical protein FB45DRAFT_1061602 [Roridomyces roridus]|uniref:F-box domain-containing protein n=1 Tax=Roridomyces roridus TaxID=1738132 RepID=A0AAD7BKU3_9AGAR|nr:hypothetical protein FB45DRAFT_1061602 [Roridomyces roridus]